jgi:pimeloyl-ACP methyl ester carboxylesterase
MDYATLVADVVAWLDANANPDAHLIGHSMGGKVAMRLACEHPGRVRRLVVEDIAPKSYRHVRDRSVEAITRLDLGTLVSRLEAEQRLEDLVPDLGTRRFLLSNLERTPEGGFRWIINLPALAAWLPALKDDSLRADHRFDGEVLFVLGGKSRAFVPEDADNVRAHFPRVRFTTIESSGHNPHTEARERFVAEVASFLEEGA